MEAPMKKSRFTEEQIVRILRLQENGLKVTEICRHTSTSDSQGLAGILKRYWQEKEGGPDFSLEEKARRMLPERTRAFGLAYQDIVSRIVSG